MAERLKLEAPLVCVASSAGTSLAQLKRPSLAMSLVYS
jgi:hypothetical protein